MWELIILIDSRLYFIPIMQLMWFCRQIVTLICMMITRNPFAYDSSSFPRSPPCRWRRGWAHQVSKFDSSRRNHQSRQIYQTERVGKIKHFRQNVICELYIFFLNYFCLIYLKKLKASDPDAQVTWIKLDHNAEHITISLCVVHWHQVSTRGFAFAAELWERATTLHKN